MITRCALAVITERGANVVLPTMSTLTADEQDFLGRHIAYVRALPASDNTVYCVFRPGSATRAELEVALSGSDHEFLRIATWMVEALAASMRGSPKAKENCVLALVTSTPDDSQTAQHVTFLKLDAKIEAAHLERAKTGGGIQLRIFKDLLPAPGDMQKGVSWPDPRQPKSELILHDTNSGEAALYFGNAFALSISSKAVETEKALVTQLVKQLGPARAAEAIALVDENGGRADAVVDAVRERYTDFEPKTRPLGGGGGLPGEIRPHHLGGQKLAFSADGIELKVPISRMSAIRTVRDGDRFVTTIRTSTPLTDPVNEGMDGV
ncbi:MAG: hypothetical protein NVS9B11_22070 [Candidatus Dormibacteraceae bacterium]